MIPRKTVLGAACACLLLAGCGQIVESRMEEARAELAAHDFGAARVDLAAALRERPEDPRLLALLAEVLLRMNDAVAAAPIIARLAVAAPDAADTHRLRAELALLSGHPGEVEGLLGEDGGPATWRLRALAAWRLGDLDRARTAFERGMAAGQDARLAADFAAYCLATDDPRGARAVLDAMRGFAPQAFETLMLAGRLAQREGQGKQALESYTEAARRYPTRFEPLLGQAEVLERQGRLAAALDLVAKALELAPGEAQLAIARLRLLARKGDWTKVRDLLQSHEGDLVPASPEGIAYAEALLRLGRAEQARMLLTRALLMAPRDVPVRTLLGETQLALGDAKGALETLAPLARDPLVSPAALALAERAAREAGDPVAETWRAHRASIAYRESLALADAGAAAWMRGDWETAVAVYGRLPEGGANDLVMHRLALGSSRLGRHDEAIRFADQAMASEGLPSAEDRHIAGWVRFVAGRDAGRALDLLRAAVAQEPGNAAYRSVLEKAEAAAG